MVKENSNFDERLAQLLSEYLDGQLPPDQVEKVERRLAEDARARRLLAEIKQVSALVGDLPRAPAPEDLAEQIQLQLEREVLLGAEDAPFEAAGRTHLRLRRWLAAAAMLMLTGAVVIIVYSILIGPLPTFKPSEEPATPGNEIVATEPQPPTPLTAIAPEADVESSLQYRLVHLEIPSNNLTADQEKLESLLGSLNIKQVERAHPDAGRADFAFNYPLDQLEQIVEILTADPNQDINLIFDDDPAQPPTIIAGVDKTQLMIWAGLQDRQKRSMLARELAGDINFLRKELPEWPEWLRDEILQTRLPPPDIRLLAAAAQPGAKEPNALEEINVIIEPNALIDKPSAETSAQTPLMVKIILTLQLEREPLPEGQNI